jgi:transposase-like protein
MLVMRKRIFSIDQWRKIVAEQAVSGLSIAAYCRRAKVPLASFYTWRRKLRGTVRFAEVKIAPEPAGKTSGIELRLPGRRCVVVRAGFDRQTLQDLLDVLAEGGGGGACREARG